jgi:hypothetical protein
MLRIADDSSSDWVARERIGGRKRLAAPILRKARR